MSTQCTLCFPDDGTAKEDTIPLDGMPREDHRDKDEVLEERAGTGANQGIYRSGSINNAGIYLTTFMGTHRIACHYDGPEGSSTALFHLPL